MKTCIVLLLPNTLRHKWLTGCLTSLTSYYLNAFPTDVVIFHESGFSVSNQLSIKQQLPNITVVFKEIQFTIPNIVKNDTNFKPRWCDGYWGADRCISYGGMCTFFAMDIFRHLNEMGYSYYARLDDDSEIKTPIGYDMFNNMKSNNLVYCYNMSMWEAPHVICGAFDFIHSNLNENSIINKQYRFDDSNRMLYYYNNFEVVNVDLYLNRTKEINALIHESGNIYYYRWGDAPIRTILLNLLFDKNSIRKMQFSYSHNDIHTSGCREQQ